MGIILDALREDILDRYNNPEYLEDGENEESILERYNHPEYWNEELISNVITDEIINRNYQDFVVLVLEMENCEKEMVINYLKNMIDELDGKNKRIIDYMKKLRYLKGEII